MSNGNLSVVKIKSAKVPVDKKQLKLFDGGGLYLLVTAKGGKYWRLDYRFNGKRKTLALGVYPDVSLSDARDLRHAEWSEFDLEAAQWRIPAEKMKMGRMHLVPLSRQVVAILRDLEPLTGRGKYLFPSVRSTERPMSENTVNAGLRRMSFEKSEICGHGFHHFT